jgi:DNA-binding beta-propeller fold protein YncE
VQRWYITFHGGDGPHTWNNIHVFDLDGKPLGKALDTHSLPDGLELRELRGFAFGPDGDLYVANAFKNASQVLRFAGNPNADGKHAFKAVFVEQHKTNPGLAHPFDVAFGPDRHLYVPSQDSNVVGRYYGPAAKDGTPGAPMPHPFALRETGETYLPGTFVPSRKHHPRGLRAVRRAVFGPAGDLFVADRDTDRVNRYDGGSGALQREYQGSHLTKPVHLLFRPTDSALLVGSRDQNAVFAIDTDTGAIASLVAAGTGGLNAPAGMAFGPDGKLYVASREGRQILRFDARTGKPDAAPFITDLEDFPEFIVLVYVGRQ